MKLFKLFVLTLAMVLAFNGCASKKEPATIIDTESQDCGQSKDGCSSDY